ncbi:MAG: hypothetical protein AAF362_21360, partial [Pseudomonadota bacterium]
MVISIGIAIHFLITVISFKPAIIQQHVCRNINFAVIGRNPFSQSGQPIMFVSKLANCLIFTQ